MIRRLVPVALVVFGCTPAPDTTANPDRIEIASDDLRVIPTPDVLARVVDVASAGDGSIWVLNSAEPFFVVLGTDGRVERSFGRRGGGPDEFDDPIGLVSTSAGQVWAFDNLRKAFRPASDDRVADVTLPTDWRLVSFGNAGMGMVATPPWFQSRGPGFVIARKRPSAPPSGGLGIWHADLFEVGPESDVRPLQPVGAVADLLADPAERFPGATILLPFPLWSVCGDGTLALYDPMANTIRRFAPDGGEGSPISLDEVRGEAVTFERLFGMLFRHFSDVRPGGQAPDSLQMRSVLGQQFEQAEGAFADVFPEYADLRCTDGGSIWLQPFHVVAGRFARDAEWERFAADGSRTTVAFPSAFRVHEIEDDRVWGVVIDELGVAEVAWVGVGG